MRQDSSREMLMAKIQRKKKGLVMGGCDSLSDSVSSDVGAFDRSGPILIG
jgi:hypothetical protein